MAKGINISIASDVRAFQSGIDDVTSSLDQVTAKLDQATESGDQAGQSIQGAMERAQQTTAEANRTVEQGSQQWSDYRAAVLQSDEALSRVTASGKTATNTTEVLGRSSQKAGEQIEESGKLGESALMNLGFSSMQAGTLFSSGLGGMMEQAGTFAAFMGPSMATAEGAISGLAWPITIAGVALAAFSGLLQNANTDTTTLTQAVHDYVSAALGSEAGSDKLDQGIRAWAKDATDFGGTSLTDLKNNLKDSGIEFGNVAAAIATQSVPAMKAQKQAIDEYVKNVQGGFIPSSNANLDALNKVSSVLQTNIDQQRIYNETLQATASQMGLSVPQYKGYESVLQDATTNHVALNTAQKNQIQAALEAGASVGSLKKDISDYAAEVKQSQQDQDNWNQNVHQSFSAAAEDSSDWAKDTKADLGQVATNLAEANQQFAELPGNLSKAMKSGLSQAGAEFLESLPNGEQIINQLGLDPNSSTAKKLIAQANEAGANAGKSVSDGLAKVPPFEVKVTAAADTAEAKKRLAALKEDLKPKVDPIPDVSEAKKKLDELTKKRTMSVVPDVDLTQAEKDLNYLLRDRTVNVTVKTRGGVNQ